VFVHARRPSASTTSIRPNGSDGQRSSRAVAEPNQRSGFGGVTGSRQLRVDLVGNSAAEGIRGSALELS
jgi:hypothetical protein